MEAGPDSGEALRPWLHLARRSGSLAVGHRAVREALKRGRCHLVVRASDAGESLRRLETGRVPVLVLGDRALLGGWLGRGEVAILGLTDHNLAAGALARIGSG
ncbi:MAG: 50S ribosomal protein L7ae [Candidatus Krumholzibacteriota bacterium]|nr:50S ribosomal protein L7ae [Candidatus Krumholzibacteriota bacterium]